MILTIILILIIWIGYGLFAAYQSESDQFYDNSNGADFDWKWILYPAFAPIVFIVKATYGAFKKYK